MHFRIKFLLFNDFPISESPSWFVLYDSESTEVLSVEIIAIEGTFVISPLIFN